VLNTDSAKVTRSGQPVMIEKVEEVIENVFKARQSAPLRVTKAGGRSKE